MDLRNWAFPLHGLQNERKKKTLGRRTYSKSCLLCYVPYTLSFPVCCVLRGGKDGVSALDVVGFKCRGCRLAQKYSFFHQEVSQWPPSGLTVCLQAVELAAAAPLHLHCSVSKETTGRESVLSNCLVFVYFNLFCILKKRNQILNRCFLCCWGMFFIIFPWRSLTPCTAVQFIHFDQPVYNLTSY